MAARSITAPERGATAEVRVWDVVVRVFHWSTVTLFTLAYLIEKPRDLHEALGYTLMAILSVRIVWGFVGTRHARFTDFVPSPRRFMDYVRDMMAGRERRCLGHNPAGGAMVVALMLVLAGIGLSGWIMGLDRFWGADWAEELHEGLVTVAVVLVAAHVSGVVYASLRHGENLVRSMWTGLKSRE
ncbi:cytochrome B [Halovulum dunhuangense]|uniref:Cytochrome B n=1 Tax=Halovulum dunhuangense TaxID=1505036 RepID=A0A849L180_9RHOB|nr:cytochrome b/b6 domain-containing protein [Halovulum dunhuangense]NNU79979.1 cytochrome B [Halovulum dunhuangense]